MVGLMYGTRKLIWLLALVCLPLAAQNIPDAPAPKNPQPGQFPDDAPPAPKNLRPEDHGPVSSSTPAAPVRPQSEEGVVTDLAQFGKLSVPVNFVQVPVIVKDSSGHLLPGLSSRDFTVYEDGLPQRLSFFYSGSVPLTAAVVVQTELPASTMKKVTESLPALIGAFSEFDEVALFTYGHTVSRVSTFSGAASVSTATLNRIKRTGGGGGPPGIFGPVAAGPTINGHDINDPNAQGITASGAPPPQKEFYVLNDAILRAAQDLSKRDRSRRKVIFVVSDGREIGSSAGFDEVKRVLLSYNIAVYAVGVDTAAMPLYDKLGRIRVPGFGTGNIIPRYVEATGGWSLAEFDRQSIEQAYARITDLARNQYTLGYYARASTSTAFRTIEVRVHNHGPNLSVLSRAGYYPLPPQPATSR
jgi:VWFA-related protein